MSICIRTLDEIVTLQRGHDLLVSSAAGGIYPVIGSSGIIAYHNSFTCAAPCITIGRSGSGVGKVRYTNKDSWAHNTTLYVKDLKGNDPIYVYYLLLNTDLKVHSGGSAVPTLNRNHLSKIVVNYETDIGLQKTKGSVLLSLDTKIDQIIQHIKKLEDIIHALYQSWFSNFNYPDATGEMRESENLHMKVPKDWIEMRFGEFLMPCSEKIGDIPAPVYSTTNNGISLRDEKFNKSLSKSQNNNKKIVKDDLIFGLSREILNFGVMTAEIGSVSPVYQIFKIDQSIFLPFMLELEIRVNMPNYMDILQLGSREGQGISKDYLLNKYILVPDMKVQKRFEEIHTAIKSKINKLTQEMAVLAEIRDTLLSKLMSGELLMEVGEV